MKDFNQMKNVKGRGDHRLPPGHPHAKMGGKKILTRKQ